MWAWGLGLVCIIQWQMALCALITRAAVHPQVIHTAVMLDLEAREVAVLPTTSSVVLFATCSRSCVHLELLGRELFCLGILKVGVI